MIKTKEDVDAMIEIVEMCKISLVSFGLWVVYALATPRPGVICEDPRFLPSEDSEKK